MVHLKINPENDILAITGITINDDRPDILHGYLLVNDSSFPVGVVIVQREGPNTPYIIITTNFQTPTPTYTSNRKILVYISNLLEHPLDNRKSLESGNWISHTDIDECIKNAIEPDSVFALELNKNSLLEIHDSAIRTKETSISYFFKGKLTIDNTVHFIALELLNRLEDRMLIPIIREYNIPNGFYGDNKTTSDTNTMNKLILKLYSINAITPSNILKDEHIISELLHLKLLLVK